MLAKQHIESAVSSLQVTTQVLVTLNELVKQKQFPRTVWQRLRELKGQTFFSPHDLADAIVELLSTILTEEQIQKYGDVILQQMQTVGINEETRQTRLTEIEEDLHQFHHHAPIKPYPPTDTPCPFCHSPYRYSVLELLAAQPNILDRVKRLIIGDISIPLRDLENVLLALEIWLFHHHDTALFAKKKTMVGTMIRMLHQGYQTMMENLTDFDPFENTDDSADSASSSGASTPTPPPAPTLDGN